MDVAAVGVAQKEDRQWGIGEQDIFDGVVLFLAAITFRLCSRVLGADNAPFPFMAKGDADAAQGRCQEPPLSNGWPLCRVGLGDARRWPGYSERERASRGRERRSSGQG